MPGIANGLLHKKMMKKALELAVSVKGRTGDNPAVGAVLYKKNRIISTGRTHLPGRAHAEADALKKAGARARGATLAVTLEPCSIYGRTGPCTRAIIDAGVKKVYVAVKDPNPKINGRGVLALRRAGIGVHAGLYAEEAAALNQDFFKYIRTGMPLVTVKAAMTLNGMIAASSFSSKWISAFEARKMVHGLRARTDAVLVGLNTVLKDNPLLTVRHVKGRNPARIVVSHGPDLPARSRIARTARAVDTYLITPKKVRSPRCRHVKYLDLNLKVKKLGVPALLRKIGQIGIKNLLVEGGSRIFSAFVREKCVDRFILFICGKILMNGIPFIQGAATKSVKQAVPLRILSAMRMGSDILVCAKPGG